MPGVTLDAGGLIALDRNDRRVVVLLARARETGARVTVPATALAQAMLFKVGGQVYAIPNVHVIDTTLVDPHATTTTVKR